MVFPQAGCCERVLTLIRDICTVMKNILDVIDRWCIRGINFSCCIRNDEIIIPHCNIERGKQCFPLKIQYNRP